ncbi:hypothetical protein HN51_037775 [Arachis hypogaea]|uniref:uncharacterized protein n=1 Tax=Arachis hypogaea TaxID=3818 RepID=UPI000DEC9AFC|nr:uncharacterized protein LOC112791966 [Arachis hypogaea]QHO03384.1 uncharacterized protein DS421_13g431770 [Arachis hypogaea]
MGTLSLWAVLCESKRIINAHSRHFLALSVIFLLPLSFSLIVSPTLLLLFDPSPAKSTSSRLHVLLRLTTTTSSHHTHHQPHPQLTLTSLLFPLCFSIFLFLTSIGALSSITHSVLHGFFGRPVKLHSALLSILSSFLPLLSTHFFSHLLLLLPLLPLLFIPPPSSSSPLIQTILYFFLLILLTILLVNLRISWTLAPVIAVAESSYALRPLRRSAALVRTMKPLAASTILFFGLLEGLLLWSSSVLVTTGGVGAWWKDWAVVLQIVLTSTTLMVLMLYHTAADTVLYMYCKAVHGELAMEIAEEFAREYVSLPFDEEKVPHVVSVVPRVSV